MQADLSPTARVILGMLMLGARSGYEIKQRTDVSTRFFWGASYGQIYPELRRLTAAGLVESEDEFQGARRRRLFRLTRRGRDALRGWLRSREPLEFALRDEALLKFFFGAAVEPEEVLANVRQRIEEQRHGLALFKTIGAEGHPGLALEYGIAFLEWDIGWWEAMERRLSRPAPARSFRRAGRAARGGR